MGMIKKSAQKPGPLEESKPVGRPSSKRTLIITIKSADTLDAIKKDDIALAIEKSIQNALPGRKVYVQTKQRLDKTGIPYDFNSVLNIIRIDSYPIKFNWELRDYITNFIIDAKGKEDYKFTLILPKEM